MSKRTSARQAANVVAANTKAAVVCSQSKKDKAAAAASEHLAVLIEQPDSGLQLEADLMAANTDRALIADPDGLAKANVSPEAIKCLTQLHDLLQGIPQTKKGTEAKNALILKADEISTLFIEQQAAHDKQINDVRLASVGISPNTDAQANVKESNALSVANAQGKDTDDAQAAALATSIDFRTKKLAEMEAAMQVMQATHEQHKELIKTKEAEQADLALKMQASAAAAAALDARTRAEKVKADADIKAAHANTEAVKASAAAEIKAAKDAAKALAAAAVAELTAAAANVAPPPPQDGLLAPAGPAQIDPAVVKPVWVNPFSAADADTRKQWASKAKQTRATNAFAKTFPAKEVQYKAQITKMQTSAVAVSKELSRSKRMLDHITDYVEKNGYYADYLAVALADAETAKAAKRARKEIERNQESRSAGY